MVSTSSHTIVAANICDINIVPRHNYLYLRYLCVDRFVIDIYPITLYRLSVYILNYSYLVTYIVFRFDLH